VGGNWQYSVKTESLLILVIVARGVGEHCYRKKAATVGQNGRISASYNFLSFLLIKS
jgi:hypothetical protein